MNPFERLRLAIDKVNLVYQYEEEPQDEPERDEPVSQPVKQLQPQVITDSNELNRIKEMYNNAQTSQIKQINALASKIEQMAKQIKRSEATIQSQMNDIVSLEKENELLKENLNEQYKNIVTHDEKERKLKEEIYRINITVNQLATEINAERNQKKQLLKQLENAKLESSQQSNQYKQALKRVEGEKERVKSQLQERIQMFEYNVKKNADDRKEYKNQLAKLQQNYQKTLNGYRIEIDRLKQDLFQSKKQSQILSLRKQNQQEQALRTNVQLQQMKEINKRLEEQLRGLAIRYQDSVKSNEALQQSNSYLGSQLEQQKKNIKVKVVEVRDETVLMELEMYKRQCKQLMQERAILNSISRSERSIEPGYKVVSTEALIGK